MTASKLMLLFRTNYTHIRNPALISTYSYERKLKISTTVIQSSLVGL